VKFSSREAMLALVAAAVILFGGSAMLVKPKLVYWKELRAKQGDVIQHIEQDKRLVAERGKWTNQLEALSKMLPQHPADKKVDVYWLSIMDNLASKHGVKISKRQAGEEKKQGDVYELPIDCNEWEGNLDSIVHFLFDLQSEGAMLDIRQLLIKQKEKGLLRGRFSLCCAYTRAPQGK